jgi:hypothetical protein
MSVLFYRTTWLNIQRDNNFLVEEFYLLGYNAVKFVASQQTKVKAGDKPIALHATCFQAGFLLGLLFYPENGGQNISPKRRLTCNGLHGVISQETKLFIITAVRTSNATIFQFIVA